MKYTNQEKQEHNNNRTKSACDKPSFLQNTHRRTAVTTLIHTTPKVINVYGGTSGASVGLAVGNITVVD